MPIIYASVNLERKKGFYPTKKMQHPAPLRNGYIYMKDAHGAESNEKSYFWPIRFLFFELCSILYSKFIEIWSILSTKTSISEKIKIAKIGKLIVHSSLHILHLTCKFGHFWNNFFFKRFIRSAKLFFFFSTPPSEAASLDPACFRTEDPCLAG